uniref:XK-related protein n=1 Tax=Strigamia maritima TaxID=126957 RepID=T1IQS7_STRMM
MATLGAKIVETDENKRDGEDSRVKIDEIKPVEDGKDDRVKTEEIKPLEDGEENRVVLFTENPFEFTRWDFFLSILTVGLFYFDFVADIYLMRYCSDDVIEPVSPVPRIIPDPERYYAFRAYFDKTTGFLKLIESFVESAPQLVLQIFILVTQAGIQDIETGHSSNNTDVNSTLNISTGSITEQASNSTELQEVEDINDHREAIQVMVIVGTSFSLGLSQAVFTHGDNGLLLTVITVAAFVSSLPILWFLLVIFIRWSVMSTWLLATNFYQKNVPHHSVYFVYGLFYLFSFVKIKDNHSGRKYIFYYAYEVIEVSILVVMWFQYKNDFTTSMHNLLRHIDDLTDKK